MGMGVSAEYSINSTENSTDERGETSSPDLGSSKILSEERSSPYHDSPMDYFRDEAKRRYHLSYLEHEEERDPRIKKQIKALVGILDKEMQSFIDWWLDGAGKWCNYDPKLCFTIRTHNRYENREVIARIWSRGRDVIEG